MLIVLPRRAACRIRSSQSRIALLRQLFQQAADHGDRFRSRELAAGLKLQPQPPLSLR